MCGGPAAGARPDRLHRVAVEGLCRCPPGRTVSEGGCRTHGYARIPRVLVPGAPACGRSCPDLSRRCHGGWRADSAALLEPPWPIHHHDHEFFRCGSGRGPAKDPGPVPGLGFRAARGPPGLPGGPGGAGMWRPITTSYEATGPGGASRGSASAAPEPGSARGRGTPEGGPEGACPGHRGAFKTARTRRPAEACPSAIRGRAWLILAVPVSGAAVGGSSAAGPAGRRKVAKSRAPGRVCRGPKLWLADVRETYAAPAGTWSSLREARERPAPRDEGGSLCASGDRFPASALGGEL